MLIQKIKHRIYQPSLRHHLLQHQWFRERSQICLGNLEAPRIEDNSMLPHHVQDALVFSPLIDNRFFLIFKGQEHFTVNKIISSMPYLVADIN